MLIIDDTNWKTQVGNGRYVDLGGERWLLSYEPPPPTFNAREFSKPFGAEIPRIPRSEWPARIKEQAERKRRISDHQRWPCDAQSGPSCWAAGTVQAYSNCRVMQMGLEHYVRISARSIAVPINGGRSGGYEGNAVRYLTQHGGVDSRLWGYGAMSPSVSEAEVAANRLLHESLESYECDCFDDFATALLLGFPCTVSYNWWSHVVMLCDLRLILGAQPLKVPPVVQVQHDALAGARLRARQQTRRTPAQRTDRPRNHACHDCTRAFHSDASAW